NARSISLAALRALGLLFSPNGALNSVSSISGTPWIPFWIISDNAAYQVSRRTINVVNTDAGWNKNSTLQLSRTPIQNTRVLSAAGSKIELQCQLDVSFSLRPQNLAEGGAIHVAIRRIEDGRVAGVERFSAKFDALGFADRKGFL